MSTKRTHKTEEELANGVKRLKVQESGAAKKGAAKAKSPAKAKPPAKKTEAKSPVKKTEEKSPAKAKSPAKERTPAKKAEAKSPAKKAEAVKKTEAAKKTEANEPPFLKSRIPPVHSLAQRASQSGAVFVFGNGDCGQLGLGEDMLERKKPFPVGALAGEAVVDVACGGLHTMALTAGGALWSWGCNDQQALGRSGDEFEAAP
ncbi:hypothetical protein GGH95_005152, partial [Coemansia sp. RSA 1836]